MDNQYVNVGLGAATPADFPSQFIGMVTKLNNDLRTALIPLHPIINTLPVPPPPYGEAWRQQLKDRPLDALINLFAPIQRLATRIVTRCDQILGGNHTLLIGLPGINQTNVDMRLKSFAELPPTAQEWCQRMQVINNFLIFAYYRPDILARALPDVMAGDIRWVMAQVTSKAQEAIKTAATLIATGQKKAEQVVQTVKSAVDNLPKPPLPGMRGLGATGVDDAAVAGAGAYTAGTGGVSAASTVPPATATGGATAATVSPPIATVLVAAIPLATASVKAASDAGVFKKVSDVDINALPGGKKAQQAAAVSTPDGVTSGAPSVNPLVIVGLLAGAAYILKKRK